jgi:hypothetical protein
MLRRILFASALAVAGLGLAAPAGASAATTLGETFAPAFGGSCVGGMDGYEVVQTHRASGPSYAAPSAGVLTSWSFQPSTTESTTLTLRVFRPTASPHQFKVIADAGLLQTIAASSVLKSFTAHIPVEAGDLIGIHSTDGACATQTSSPGDVYDGHILPPITPVGGTGLYSEGSGNIYDISAKLEPDCDKDGLGDDTEDLNVSAACPTPSGPGTGGPTGPTTKKKCKKHKKKHKRSAESAKKKKCKKKKKKR